MTINTRQLEQYIIHPALDAIGMYTLAASNLLLGTCAQESAMGTYVAQKGVVSKGGLGIFQCEARTYQDLWDNFIDNDKALRAKIFLYTGYSGRPPANRLVSDMALAAIICRLCYARVKEPLPDKDDISGMATYWKLYYNSNMGRGTTAQFVENYKRYVLGG